MSTFLQRASLHILDQSSIPTLIKRVSKGSDPPSSVAFQTQSQFQSFSEFADGAEPEGRAQRTALAAQLWMTYVSKHCPALYKSHIGEMTKAIADERNTRLVEVCLQALAVAAKWDPKLAPSDKSVILALASPSFADGCAQTDCRASHAFRHGVQRATCEVCDPIGRVHEELRDAAR